MSKFKIIDEKNNEKEANGILEFIVDGKNYLLYTTVKGEEHSHVLVSLINNGLLKDINDIEEKEKINNEVRDLLFNYKEEDHDLVDDNMIDKSYHINLLKSYVFVTSNERIARLEKEIDNYQNKEKIITFIDRKINFMEGICQRVNEDDTVLETTDYVKNNLSMAIHTIKNNIPKSINEVGFEIKNEITSINKKQKEERHKKRILSTSGYIANRILILESIIIIVIISLIISLKILF